MYGKKDGKGEWETVRTDTAGRKFYLEDATGKVLVDPQCADYELPDSFRVETGWKSSRFVDPSLGVPGPTEKDLLTYLTGDLNRTREALRSAQVPGTNILDPALGLGAKLQSLGVSLGAGSVSVGFGDQKYRFTETCLPADRECNVLGSCAENPNPGDNGDRNIIRRDENEKTLMITTKSESKLRRDCAAGPSLWWSSASRSLWALRPLRCTTPECCEPEGRHAPRAFPRDARGS